MIGYPCHHIININQHQDSSEKGNLYLGGVGSLKDVFLIEAMLIHSVLTVIDETMYKHYKIAEKIQKYNIKNHKWVRLEDD